MVKGVQNLANRSGATHHLYAKEEQLPVERRISLRARTDFSVQSSGGLFGQRLRAVEVSSVGLVVSDRVLLEGTSRPLLVRLRIQLPERKRPIFALARSVRTYGYQEALRFVEISDVDRLTIAEHIDVLHRRGALLH